MLTSEIKNVLGYLQAINENVSQKINYYIRIEKGSIIPRKYIILK